MGNNNDIINLLTNCAQIMDRAKQEWLPEGAWTEWDQSVRDGITAALKQFYAAEQPAR